MSTERTPRDDTPLLVLAVVLGLTLTSLTCKLAFWPEHRHQAAPSKPSTTDVRLDDFNLSNYGGTAPVHS